MSVELRDATVDDLSGIMEIYNDAVVNTTAIWNEVLVDLENRKEWFAARKSRGFPVIVAILEAIKVIIHAIVAAIGEIVFLWNDVVDGLGRQHIAGVVISPQPGGPSISFAIKTVPFFLVLRQHNLSRLRLRDLEVFEYDRRIISNQGSRSQRVLFILDLHRELHPGLSRGCLGNMRL